MKQGDSEFGCAAFGHLASPFVDGELPRDESQRFAVHLDACRPCQQLVASYRAIDVIARSPVPAVTEADWERAWGVVRQAIDVDREARAGAPLATVARMSTWLGSPRRRAWLRPLAYAAAAALLVVLTLRLQPDTVPGTEEHGSVRSLAHASGPASAAPTSPESLSIACLAPDFVPVVYTIDGEEPLTVLQCAWVGEEPPVLPTQGPMQGPTEGPTQGSIRARAWMRPQVSHVSFTSSEKRGER